jgi:osmoprotectant transport system permease protein
MSLFADPRWAEALGHLPDYLGNHVRVSVTALALGLLVSLPLAILSRHRPVLRGALLGLASIVQTVPGLALLALFYPLLLALAALSLSWFGFGFSAFGFCRRCWRSRSIRCCRCCATPSPACRAWSLQSWKRRRASA